MDDLIPVAQVSASPFYMAVSAENKDFTDGASLLEYIKANPGKFTYANAGNGGIAHLAFASFLKAEGLDALSVPFTRRHRRLLHRRDGRPRHGPRRQRARPGWPHRL